MARIKITRYWTTFDEFEIEEAEFDKLIETMDGVKYACMFPELNVDQILMNMEYKSADFDKINNYSVIVGNIGCVKTTKDLSEAIEEYKLYVELSKTDYGRAGGESVILMNNNEIIEEYLVNGINNENKKEE